jgi:hypothetical protein
MTNGEIAAAKAAMDELIKALESLTDEKRLECIGTLKKNYCLLCGSADVPCYCDPAYDI